MKSPSQQGALAGPLFLLLPIAIAVVAMHMRHHPALGLAPASIKSMLVCCWKIPFFEPLFAVLVWIINLNPAHRDLNSKVCASHRRPA